MSGYTHKQVMALAETGAIKSVELRGGAGGAGGFGLFINGQALVSQRKDVRSFAKAETAFRYILELGLDRIDLVDLHEWQAGGAAAEG